MGLRDVLAGKSPAPDVDLDPGAVDLEEVKKEVRRSGKRLSRIEQEAERERVQAAIDTLYEGENWEEIASLPFNARYAMTGWDGFLLSDKQKAVLSTSLAAVMRTLLIIDPKYVAMIIFTVNFGGVWAEKEMSYRAYVKAKQSTDGRGARAGS